MTRQQEATAQHISQAISTSMTLIQLDKQALSYPVRPRQRHVNGLRMTSNTAMCATMSAFSKHLYMMLDS